MKIKIHKHCKIHGKAAKPGEIHEVHEARAKALTDNHYAEPVEPVADPTQRPVKTPAGGADPAPSANAEPLTAPVEAVKIPDPESPAE